MTTSLTADELVGQIDALAENGTDADKAEARRLRKEVAKFREAKESAEQAVARYEAFESLHDEDVAAVAAFAQLVGPNPAAAAEMAVAFGRSLAGAAGTDFNALVGINTPDDEPDTDDSEGSDDMTGMTDEQVQALINERVEALVSEKIQGAISEYQQQESIRSQVLREVENLGYAPDLDDPKTVALLSLAARSTDGDIGKAHEVLSGAFGAADAASNVTDDESVQSTSSDELVPAPDGVPASGTPHVPQNMDEAEASAMARLSTAFVDG